MNTHDGNTDNNSSHLSQEVKDASDELRQKLLALRRKKAREIIESTSLTSETIIKSSDITPTKESIPATDSEEAISLDFTSFIPEIEEVRDSVTIHRKQEDMIQNMNVILPGLSLQTVSEEVIAPEQEMYTIMEELTNIEKDINTVLPTLVDMAPETKKQIMANIAHHEANWETLKPTDIKIDKEEVNMWGGFIGGAKKADFVEQKVVETLERGEIVDLTIDGYESFQIVKIRARDKDACAMSMVEFIKKDPKSGKLLKGSRDYLIKLPLVEGGTFSIIKKETMQTLVSYTIRKMSINKKHQSLIRKFFDLFA